MKITKVSERLLNIEKDNQSITITWKECLQMLDKFIYSEPGEKVEIILDYRKED